jgi:ornithine cyclodeaminase/alanine dehydrogenase-like protein (mu-crystallin family)
VRMIDEQTVRAHITWPLAIEAMRHAFRSIAEGTVVAPNEFVMNSPGDVHVKGAYLHGSKWVVFKVAAAGFPLAGNSGCFFILSADSGKIDSFVNDGGWMTEVRTAAAGALSIDMLARRDASKIAIIGTGIQAAFQLEALRSIRHLKEVRVAARSIERTRTFASTHSAKPCDSIDQAIDGADIVLCATTSREALLDRVAPGTHVTSIGVDMVGKCELSAALIDAADVVAVDDIALSRSLGILQTRERLTAVTLGDILLKRAYGRVNDQQVTIAGLSGLGVQDAAIAEALMSQLNDH